MSPERSEKYQTDFDRRQLLVGLVSVSFILASGCASFRRGSELEAAGEELESILRALEVADDTKLLAIAGKMRDRSLAMREAHIEFTESFNEAAVDRATMDATLDKFVDSYELRRTQARSALLAAQDELHAAVPVDAWPEILEVLNTKAHAATSQTGSRS